MWMFTSACPSRCTYCDIASQQGKASLSTAEVESVCHQLLEEKFSEVMFAGGEALLSPNLPAALRILRGKARTVVFTGGLPGLERRSIDILREGEVSRLVFSIDAGEAALNDRIRGREGVTADLLGLVAAVAEELPRVDRSINTVVSRYNVEALPAVWDRVSPHGMRSWSLTLAGDFFEGNPAHAFIERAKLRELYLQTIPALARRLSAEGAELVVLPIPLPLLAAGLPPARWDELDAELREAVEAELELFARGEFNASFVQRFGCPLVGMDIVIGVGGEIHPCSQAPAIHPDFVMGNVRETPLREILRGAALESFAAGIPNAPCTRCWAPSNIPRALLAQILGRGAEPPPASLSARTRPVDPS